MVQGQTNPNAVTSDKPSLFFHIKKDKRTLVANPFGKPTYGGTKSRGTSKRDRQDFQWRLACELA